MGYVILTESNLQNIADAIRFKNGLSTSYSPTEMADAIREIPGGSLLAIVDSVNTTGVTAQIVNRSLVSELIIPSGNIDISVNGAYDVVEYASAAVDVDPLDGYIDGTGYILSANAPFVREYAFHSHGALTSVTLSQASWIGSYAFLNCPYLQTVSIPSAIYIHEQAFFGCPELAYINMPQVMYVESSAFANCSLLLAQGNLPNLVEVGESAFYRCGISQINASKLTMIGSYAFYSCLNLEIVNIPIVGVIPSYAFAYCHSLSLVQTDLVHSVYSFAFAECTSLERFAIDANYVYVSWFTRSYASIYSYAFLDCHSLSEFIIQGEYSVSLLHSNAFANTPLTDSSYLGHYGSIYVPSSRYYEFISATNWSYYSNRITSMLGE